MAEFFENLGKVVLEKAEIVTQKTGEVVEAVAKKTEKTVEVQKLKARIYGMEHSNEKAYKKIGKVVYQKYKKGDSNLDVFEEICAAIAEREEAILSAKKEIAEVKGMELCEKCHEYLAANAKFCPNCGEKVVKQEK